MAELPGGFLRDAQLAMQVHGGDVLDAGSQQVDGQGLGLIAQLGVDHDRAGAHIDAVDRHAHRTVGPTVRRPPTFLLNTFTATGRPCRPKWTCRLPWLRCWRLRSQAGAVKVLAGSVAVLATQAPQEPVGIPG